MRLDKYLGDHNLGTRKQIKEYLKNGRCTVNGIVAVKPDVHINELSDEIAFDGKVLSYARFHYFMLYKPAGVVSATNDKRNVTVLDLLKEENLKNLSPCGRLDIDTEGLLLITDDGVMIHNLLSPKKHVDKVYEVHIAHELSEEDIKRLTDGVDIGDKNDDGSVKPTLPAVVTQKERDNDGNPVIELTIHEGRFHQVKRMLEAVGNEVLFLKRLSMGPLFLDEKLAPGEYRALTDEEIKKLSKN
ncbi:16S rRNA pseudouridine516 synthase [Butyrivibrio hungatei]|uniref:Pseudouridine synthase n=1 Tax=Butyrivibrio hungatei TaxID=185008 RepID=A0A1G5AXW4_9FIRM|nr:pseudouridine synthase [Butyrivibrio hungatei]MBQ4219415.1 rRNA pseudouridine synthase [Butyrivibrio sp.]SCX82704.1 16S rRNA pseudouridine516 synthase [Butyrivibrio hungatei]